MHPPPLAYVTYSKASFDHFWRRALSPETSFFLETNAMLQCQIQNNVCHWTCESQRSSTEKQARRALTPWYNILMTTINAQVIFWMREVNCSSFRVLFSWGHWDWAQEAWPLYSLSSAVLLKKIMCQHYHTQLLWMLSWQLVLNPDIVEEHMENFRCMKSSSHSEWSLLIMPEIGIIDKMNGSNYLHPTWPSSQHLNTTVLSPPACMC